MSKEKVNKWFIAIKKRGEDLFDLTDLTVIEPPQDTYQADPFLFKRNGVTYLFYEDYNYDKGAVSYSTVSDLEVSPPTRCLELPYHISFPFLIEEGEEVYMIPETGKANCVEIFRAVQFPDKWERVKTLIPGVCAGDVVIHKTNGSYHLFTTVGGDNHQVIYQSESLLGEWRMSYSEDSQYSRPAGNIFELGGKLYQPTQDCNHSYGRAVVVNEIEFPFRKKRSLFLEPSWYPNLTGFHTFNFNDDYVVVDGRIKL